MISSNFQIFPCPGFGHPNGVLDAEAPPFPPLRLGVNRLTRTGRGLFAWYICRHASCDVGCLRSSTGCLVKVAACGVCHGNKEASCRRPGTVAQQQQCLDRGPVESRKYMSYPCTTFRSSENINSFANPRYLEVDNPQPCIASAWRVPYRVIGRMLYMRTS